MGGREMSMCERNINWLPLACPQPRTWRAPRHVPQPGIKPATFSLQDNAQPNELHQSGLSIDINSILFCSQSVSVWMINFIVALSTILLWKVIYIINTFTQSLLCSSCQECITEQDKQVPNLTELPFYCTARATELWLHSCQLQALWYCDLAETLNCFHWPFALFSSSPDGRVNLRPSSLISALWVSPEAVLQASTPPLSALTPLFLPNVVSSFSQQPQ